MVRHDPDHRDEFKERYRSELDDRSEGVQKLLEDARSGTLTLLYATADEAHNNAVTLVNYLTDRLDDE